MEECGALLLGNDNITDKDEIEIQNGSELIPVLSLEHLVEIRTW